MASDTSRGYEMGAFDHGQYDGLPAVAVVVSEGRQILYPSHVQVEGDIVTGPEPLACRWIVSGAASLIEGQSLSARGLAYLEALRSKHQTSNFDPSY